MKKLKPCPFCGGKAELKRNETNFWIECTECYVEIDGMYDSTAKLIDIWNRRVEAQATIHTT